MAMQRKRFFLRILICLTWCIAFIGLLILPKYMVQSNSRTLDVFVWGDYFVQPEILTEFEKRYAIKVRLHYYTSNEEMRIKLLSNKYAYDLVIPSGYAVKGLIKDKALKPIDKSRLHFWDKISPELLNLSFDPGNIYSIPNIWETYGFGFNTHEISQDQIVPSLAAIFDESVIDCKFAMIGDPRESIRIAATYLFGPVSSLSPSQTHQVLTLLEKQKKHVEAYSDYRSKYLIQTNNCPFALVRSSLIWEIAKTSDHIGFVQPKEATFISIENLVIPKHSKKDDLVYQFINYLYEPQVQAWTIGAAPCYPVIPEALLYINEVPEYLIDYEYSLKNHKKFIFFQRLLSDEETRNLWIDLKTR